MKIGIISDIHEDIFSLKKVLKMLEQEQVDEIACLGDIVGFNKIHSPYHKTKDANACVEAIKSNCTIVVSGNHDQYELRKIPEHTAEFHYPENWYQLDYEQREKMANNKIWLYEHDTPPADLNKSNIAYLESLPEYKISSFQNGNILFTHFIYPDITGIRQSFMFKKKSFIKHLDFMEEKNCRLSFSGHAHTEGVFRYAKKKSKFSKFGNYQIEENAQGFLIPCIADGKRANGFAIFNTANFCLDIVPLNS